MAEHSTVNRRVAGSSPAAGAERNPGCVNNRDFCLYKQCLRKEAGE